jgi:hypothetical protein
MWQKTKKVCTEIKKFSTGYKYLFAALWFHEQSYYLHLAMQVKIVIAQFLKFNFTILYLGIWVVFLKQPALPGKAPQKKFLKNKNH